MPLLRRTLAALALAAPLAACTNHDYYGTAVVTDVSVKKGNPDVILDVNAGVWMFAGTVATAQIQLQGVNGTDFSGSIQSKNTSVLSITQGSDGVTYTFDAIDAGTAEIIISVNGAAVRSTVGTVEQVGSPDAGGLDAGADAASDASGDASETPSDAGADAPEQ